MESNSERPNFFTPTGKIAAQPKGDRHPDSVYRFWLRFH